MAEGSHTLVNTLRLSRRVQKERPGEGSRALLCTSLHPVYQAEHNSYATCIACGVKEMGDFMG
jgi:hypothetical protein